MVYNTANNSCDNLIPIPQSHHCWDNATATHHSLKHLMAYPQWINGTSQNGGRAPAHTVPSGHPRGELVKCSECNSSTFQLSLQSRFHYTGYVVIPAFCIWWYTGWSSWGYYRR